MPTDVLTVEGLAKTYRSAGHETTAIADVSFSVKDGEFASVVGPSGCGKTTMLKCIAGLLRASGGHAALRGKRIDAPPPELAVVFQDYSRSLFPWMTVRKNVLLPQRGGGKAERQRRVEQSVEAVGLTEYLDHYPWQLSGGMQQRVAIARALAYQPRILLMDEPFASVDAQTRTELEDLVLQVRAEFEVTVLLVTHDIDESVYMSDRVIIMSRSPSRVQEIVHVNLPRPRHQVGTKELPEFARLRAHIYLKITQGAGIAPSGAPTDVATP